MARILMLAPQLPFPPQQGTTLRNFNLVAGLAQRHTLDLLTFLPPDARPADLEPLRALCRQVVVEPAPVRSLARRARDTAWHPLPDMALRLECPAMHGHLARLLAGERYDVIQVEGIEMAPYISGLSPRPARLVFDDHNAEYLLQQRAFLNDVRHPRRWLGAAYSLVQWQKLLRYERRVCRLSDRTVVVSEVDREALQRLAPGLPVTVVPNGVDVRHYRPGVVAPAPGLGEAAMVFTGKMDYRPNVDAVLWLAEEVLPRVQAQVPRAHFYVVGQQPHRRLAALASNPAVTVTGRVPDPRPYFAAAAVYVVPLRIGGGTRLKVLEAMAMGQAIVSTRLGCDGFPFADGRELRLADSAEEFAAAVLALLSDREQARTLGATARACVEAGYAWESILPLLEQVYA